MIKVCYRCHKPLEEIEPLADESQIIRGICDDCLKLETIEVQQAIKLLRIAGRI
jgi:NMD protein affecting ribosome stability and mRNA decay